MFSRTERAAGLLIATLIAALLASAAAVLITTSRGMRAGVEEEARVESARLRAQAIAEAAIVEMDSGTTSLRLDGSPSAPAFGSGGSISLQDVGGLLDVNVAEPPQLAALFRDLGLGPEAAATFADRIADWRDASDTKRLHGANNEDYAAAGLPSPAHRPFATEREVAAVMGVGPDLAACLEPYLTVYSRSPLLDRAVAPDYIKPLPGLGFVTGSGAGLGVPIGHVIIVTAEAPISKAAVLRLREWVRLTGDRRSPFMVHRALVDFAPFRDQRPLGRCATTPPGRGA